MKKIIITNSQYLEALNLQNGTFLPVKHFMNKKEFYSVINNMKLLNGQIFPLPIFFNINKKQKKSIENQKLIYLFFKNEIVGKLYISEIFTCDKNKIIKKLYGTKSLKHPGVKSFLKMGDFFLAGKVEISKKNKLNFHKLDLTPTKTKEIFKKKKWKTVIGFQTRNIPHLGHEFIHRNAMKKYDGLFIHPLVGEKKNGDFSMNAINKSYQCLIKKFYPKDKVFFSFLTTSMRYAGPREAIFHSIIRKNFGCTHFIIGRDHAGVGNFYKKYDAHHLAKKLKKKMKIILSLVKGPFFCKKCNKITDEDSCSHKNKFVVEIDGTKIRKDLRMKKNTQIKFLRKEIQDSIKKTSYFI